VTRSPARWRTRRCRRRTCGGSEGFVADLIDGIGEPAVRCGIIGELGCSWPLPPTERKVLQAAALAQQETGVMISVHPGRNEASLGEIRDVLASAGADLTRTVMGHMDRCGYELATRLDILDSGAVIEYDVFGMDGYYPAAAALADDHLPDMPNDGERIRQIRELIKRGYRDQVVVGHDIHMKFQLTRYGGWGYGHFLRTVVPLMHVYGIGQDEIDRLTVRTPRRLLTIK
jgi:phosphotriesterase-related protein